MIQDFKQEIRWLLEEKYESKLTEKASRDIERIKHGEPVAYVIGFVDFLGCRIDLSMHPLIPRPETEYWVEQVIKEIRGTGASIRCLDMCAGSGCVGIAVLHHIAEASIDFAEKDEGMLKQVRINTKQNHISERRFCTITSDLFSNITGRYDYILVNPPYVAQNDNTVQESVLQWEPHSALFAEHNGLAVIERILKHAPNYLVPGGELYLEHGTVQRSQVESLARKYGYRCNSYKDQYSVDRFVRCTA